MEESKLVKTFKRLSQGSKQSVQNGQDLDAFDKYLHVERPIEKAVRKAMDEIREQNGGLLLLVGSAGDGKSHMIASLKKDYPDFKYRNDASESPDPKMEAREYLKQCLEDFNNDLINTTSTKLLVAINMGKLSEFVDDDDVKERFHEIVECAQSLFDEDNLHHDQTQRVRIVSFGNHQIFELYPEKTDEEYPVDSEFIRTV
jgi:DNA phosphorothioation-dependent restriction protein DptF